MQGMSANLTMSMRRVLLARSTRRSGLTALHCVAPGAGTVTVGKMYTQWLKTPAHVKDSTNAARSSAWAVHVRDAWKIPQLPRSGVVVGALLDHHTDGGRFGGSDDRGISHPPAGRRLRYAEMAALRVGDFDMLRRRVNHERRSVPFLKFLVVELATRMEGKGPDDLETIADRRRTSLVIQQGPDRVIPGQGLTCTVGVAGFEPTTSSSRTKRATKLRHTPREATTAYRTGAVESQIDVHGPPRDGLGVSVALYILNPPA